ncbi:hypothetical protein [Mycobacteroides abscessus]|uniref:hypothetical protein n=1 Tax=Mycobacteroides abscessus TaxID=36809 RepID=UPI0015EBF34A|nr:hypothetical protein [Mycobacteroides abscessus]
MSNGLFTSSQFLGQSFAFVAELAQFGGDLFFRPVRVKCHFDVAIFLPVEFGQALFHL